MTSLGYTCEVKTVLTRIISIVRVPSLYPNKDNIINRDDDAKRFLPAIAWSQVQDEKG